MERRGRKVVSIQCDGLAMGPPWCSSAPPPSLVGVLPDFLLQAGSIFVLPASSARLAVDLLKSVCLLVHCRALLWLMSAGRAQSPGLRFASASAGLASSGATTTSWLCPCATSACSWISQSACTLSGSVSSLPCCSVLAVPYRPIPLLFDLRLRRCCASDHLICLNIFCGISYGRAPQSRADVARFEILSLHGGLYVDCDLQWLGARARLYLHMAAQGRSSQNSLLLHPQVLTSPDGLSPGRDATGSNATVFSAHQPTLEFVRLLGEVRFAASPHYMRDAWDRKVGHTTVRRAKHQRRATRNHICAVSNHQSVWEWH